MWLFIAGMVAGSVLTRTILGFMAAVVEDREMKEKVLRQREQDKKNLRDIENWYRSYY